MENETVELEAIVDKVMTVKLNIPKQIDAETLLSITQRLSKILKMSPLPDDLKKAVKQTKSKAKEGDKRKSKYDFLNDRNKAIEVFAKWKTSGADERTQTAESYGTTRDKFEKKIYYAGRKFNITPEELQQKTTQ